MEASIRKMIKEYEGKISVMDKTLEYISIHVKQRRKDGDNYDDLRQDRHIANAKRQAYVQARADFQSLINEI